jgi:hypothetical protein
VDAPLFGPARVGLPALVRRLVVALWAGALLTVGGLVAPALFRVLPERALAGLVAGELFHLVTLLSVPAAVLVFLLHAPTRVGPLRHRGWSLVPAVLLLANEYALRPVMDAARAAGQVTPAFMAWHGLSAALYAGATVVVLLLLLREARQ